MPAFAGTGSGARHTFVASFSSAARSSELAPALGQMGAANTGQSFENRLGSISGIE